ncbi:hypothetical protein [Aureibacter tunicatorum]|uniref:Ser/Thr protein kinase n=1 Tax=Aureibacter tunicatorum TaxID=866807 RepID=A0AAE4BTN5_9BACT|nr:hypothetical protein [Aureibacter tunicatorum]MDR6239832.1 putative Ser/Thr protein kinase [Aureibacter tunicatorum]BDD04307.1 hypothetical protein AUTU_17900 [Aureibacter tunicatorum]
MKNLITKLFAVAIFVGASVVSVLGQGIANHPFDRDVFEGYIITSTSDTISGALDLSQLPEYVVVWNGDAQGNRVKYRSAEIVRAKIENKIFTRVYDKNNGEFGSPMSKMMEVVVEGPVSVYKNYQMDYDPTRNLQSWVVTTVVQKEGEPPFTAQGELFTAFKKKMSESVKDNQNIAQKVMAKEEGYKKKDVDLIAKEYNEWHTNQAKAELTY